MVAVADLVVSQQVGEYQDKDIMVEQQNMAIVVAVAVVQVL